MSNINRSIKCLKCNVFTTNSDYCKNCGALISFEKKIEIRKEEEFNQRIIEVKEKAENPNLAERLKKHRFWLLRGLGWILYSAILIVSAIGEVLAWFVAMVAAG